MKLKLKTHYFGSNHQATLNKLKLRDILQNEWLQNCEQHEQLKEIKEMDAMHDPGLDIFDKT